MKTSLLTLTLVVILKIAFSQDFDIRHSAFVKLQDKYNNAIKIAMNDNKLSWASAVVVSDATVNHILNPDFNAMERYVRSIDKRSSMSQIDSAIQFAIVFSGFKTSPELVNIKISDSSKIIKTLQEGRRKTPFPKIAMGMNAINIGSSIQLASYLLANQIETTNIFFEDESKFKSALGGLTKLGILLNKSGAKFQSFQGKGKDSNKLICTFFNQLGDLAQFKLSYQTGDYFGKIQDIDFVDKRNIQRDLDGPPTVESFKNK